jgi:hypothetical protein
MRKLQRKALSGVFLTALLSAPAWGGSVARPGTLNYVEGQAFIGEQTLDAKSVGSTELEPGQALNTGVGKAELLLTPGVFFRLSDNSSVKMISPSLIDTEMELVQGRATVEVTEIHGENNLRIIEDGRSTELRKNGLYDFDADHEQVRVFNGEAVVQDDNRELKVKGGHEVDFTDGAALKAKKFDKHTYEDTELYRWTSLRSSYLAEANADAARTYVVGGMGWYGDGWYWDPWFSAYTFIPGDGIFYSPFGWGFYSPFYVYHSPLFFGGYGYGHYYHHFGRDYHAWGPGPHYYRGFDGGRYHGNAAFGGADGGRGFVGGSHGGVGGLHGGAFHGGGAGRH